MSDFILFTEGSFGNDVASALTSQTTGLTVMPLVTSSNSFNALVRRATFVGVALWRRYIRECDILDIACHENSTPWSAVVLEDSYLLSGPVIVPGVTACYSCFRRRYQTHAPLLDQEGAIDLAYDNDPTLGSPGHTPSAVALAVASLLLDRQEHSKCAGRARRVGLLSGDLDETRTVPVHGCERCSAKSSGNRYTSDLVPAISEILK